MESVFVFSTDQDAICGCSSQSEKKKCSLLPASRNTAILHFYILHEKIQHLLMIDCIDLSQKKIVVKILNKTNITCGIPNENYFLSRLDHKPFLFFPRTQTAQSCIIQEHSRPHNLFRGRGKMYFHFPL